MRAAKHTKAWIFVHKWSSLICTLFMLLLCVTGLPLIFHHEIDHLLGAPEPSPVHDGAPLLALDRIVAAGEAQLPGQVVQYIFWEQDEPAMAGLIMNHAPGAHPNDSRTMTFDGRSGELLDGNSGSGPMLVLLRLHVDMFAGLPGKLFLGAMGLLFIGAVVSGIVLYGPFTRRLSFGTVRKDRSRRLRWLDLHNLLGIVTMVWALTVGATGVLNTWAELMLNHWRTNQLAEMTAPYRDKPIPGVHISLDTVVANARKALPGMVPQFVAFPGTLFSSNHHFAVFMRGDRPLTARLLKPALVDAETGSVTDARDLPWYLTALLISQPLHFGDYGGMPLKIIWALLDLVTIVVLGSGLYLWWKRRQSLAAQRPAALERSLAHGSGLSRT
ncbi:PepSY-associated TM helix domain-containing protein [Chelatococcus sp. GCM10030263]|uniref:PepSY-associated TM helix domain-containing protein n=1 Tax=Chelatococcus sp. GCM10030263 TaxID=3273387 RepID=UPI00360E982A